MAPLADAVRRARVGRIHSIAVPTAVAFALVGSVAVSLLVLGGLATAQGHWRGLQDSHRGSGMPTYRSRRTSSASTVLFDALLSRACAQGGLCRGGVLGRRLHRSHDFSSGPGRYCTRRHIEE